MTAVAFDPGFGNIKLYGSNGCVVLGSGVSVGGSQMIRRMAGLRVMRPPLKIETTSGVFRVGENAHDWGRPVENLDFGRLTGSPEMMALLYGALTRYGSLEANVSLIVGLPIHALMDDQEETTQKALRGALRGTHKWKADDIEYTTTIDAVRITSQPVGAMFDYLLTDEGEMPITRRATLKGEIGILSIGMNTVDMLVVRSGSPVQRFMGGGTLGVRRLLELLNRNGLYSLAELDAQLREGRLDMRDVLPIWQSEVLGFVERQWGNSFKRFHSVVVVGGGALLLREPFLVRFRDKAFIPDDPIISTARGLYKYTLMRARRQK